MTCIPTCRSPPVISVIRPSLMPGVIATDTAEAPLPPGSTHTSLAVAVLAPAAADLRDLPGMRGIRLAVILFFAA